MGSNDRATSGEVARDGYGHSSIAYALGEPVAHVATYASTHTAPGTALGDIPLQTIPESKVLPGEEVADDHNMARQIIMQHPSATSGSRVSLVIPAAPSLQHQNNMTQLGSSGRTGSTDGISDTIYPLLPLKIPRYNRDRRMDSPFKPAEYELDVAQKDFSPGNLPPGWEQLTHPEGQPYFYHGDKRIITENWIWNPKELQHINSFIDQFEAFTQVKGLVEPPDTHLVLECTVEEGQAWCGYYYASASTRSVFWLERFNISDNLMDVKGEPDSMHISTRYLSFENSLTNLENVS
ncbi:hypothetical protein DXG01_005525 [Tephrocybe rancida]|nr:hypothetical protein DXG01_005525 [Tephrocybe rancida]